MAAQVSTKSSNMVCSLFCVCLLATDFCHAFSFSTHHYLICIYEACSIWLIYSWTNPFVVSHERNGIIEVLRTVRKL